MCPRESRQVTVWRAAELGLAGRFGKKNAFLDHGGGVGVWVTLLVVDRTAEWERMVGLPDELERDGDNAIA
jgi:hypothetical protein